jgi:hypothetical protein
MTRLLVDSDDCDARPARARTDVHATDLTTVNAATERTRQRQMCASSLSGKERSASSEPPYRESATDAMR